MKVLECLSMFNFQYFLFTIFLNRVYRNFTRLSLSVISQGTKKNVKGFRLWALGLTLL